MERLTDEFWRNLDPWECCGQDKYCQRGCHDVGGCTNGCKVPKLYRKLAKYEDAEEQGLLLKLPCAIGSVVWFAGNEFINDYEVRRYIVDESGVDCIQVAKEIDGKDYWNSFSIDDIGKTVFLTREEAEQALAEMKEV